MGARLADGTGGAHALRALCATAAPLKEEMTNAIIDNLDCAHEHGTDRPEITGGTWSH